MSKPSTRRARQAALLLPGAALAALAATSASAATATPKPETSDTAARLAAASHGSEAIYVSRSQVTMTAHGVVVHNPTLTQLVRHDRAGAAELVRTRFPEVKAESLSVDRSGGVLIRGVKVGRATAAESQWTGFICGRKCRPAK